MTVALTLLVIDRPAVNLVALLNGPFGLIWLEVGERSHLRIRAFRGGIDSMGEGKFLRNGHVTAKSTLTFASANQTAIASLARMSNRRELVR